MTKTKLATLFLIIGMFLNPLGFDAIQLMLIHLTGSLLKANFVLYFLAVFCFGLYFYFSGNNPIKEIRNIIQSVYGDKIKKYYKKITKKS